MDEERRNGSNWDDKTIPLEEEQTCFRSAEKYSVFKSS